LNFPAKPSVVKQNPRLAPGDTQCFGGSEWPLAAFGSLVCHWRSGTESPSPKGGRLGATIMLWDVARFELALASLTLVGCIDASSRRPEHPNVDELRLFDVCVEASGRGSANWPAARLPRALLSTADERGYVATVEVGTATSDCDHCTGPSVAVRTVHGSPPPEIPGVPPGVACVVGVGPVSEPLTHLAVLRRRSHGVETSSKWRVFLDVDLDGDGSVELEGVERCESVVRSGCDERVCNRWCRGVRAVGKRLVRSTECQTFVPDVTDCDE
jgi:hypothetical protein